MNRKNIKDIKDSEDKDIKKPAENKQIKSDSNQSNNSTKMEDGSSRLTIIWDDPNKTHKKVVDINKIEGKYMYIRPEQDITDEGEEGYSHLSEIEGTIREIREDLKGNIYGDKEKTALTMYKRLRRLGLIVRNSNKGELKNIENKRKALIMINEEIAKFNDPASKPQLIIEHFLKKEPIEPKSKMKKGIEVLTDGIIMDEETFIKKQKYQLNQILKSVKQAFYDEDFELVETLYEEFLNRKKDLDQLNVKLPDGSNPIDDDLNRLINQINDDLDLLIEDELNASQDYYSRSKSFSFIKENNKSKIQSLFEKISREEKNHADFLKYLKEFLNKYKKNNNIVFDFEKYKKELSQKLSQTEYDNKELEKMIGKRFIELPEAIQDWYPIVKNGIVVGFVSANEKSFFWITIPDNFTPNINDYDITDDKYVDINDIY